MRVGVRARNGAGCSVTVSVAVSVTAVRVTAVSVTAVRVTAVRVAECSLEKRQCSWLQRYPTPIPRSPLSALPHPTPPRSQEMASREEYLCDYYVITM